MAEQKETAANSGGDSAGQQTFNLSSLSPNKGSRRRRRRLGIGEGSGSGKTCGKGQKGQKARSGAPIPAGFEGGQMPLHRRLPKIGFRSRKRIAGKNLYNAVKLSHLEEMAGSGDITLEMIKEKGLLSSKSTLVKILADGELSKKVVVEAHAASAAAKAAIEAVGGELRIVSRWK